MSEPKKLTAEELERNLIKLSTWILTSEDAEQTKAKIKSHITALESEIARKDAALKIAKSTLESMPGLPRAVKALDDMQALDATRKDGGK